MKENIGKIFAVLFLIAIIIKAVFTFADIHNMNKTLELILEAYQDIVLTCAIPFLIFYVDRNKNDSVIGMIGYLMIGVYALIYVGTLIYTENLKADSIKDLESIRNLYNTIENVGKAASVTLILMSGIKNMSMVSIASEETENVIAKYAKVAAYLLAFVFVVLGIVLVFKSESFSGPQTITKIKTLTNYLFLFTLVMMVGFQYGGKLYEGEITPPVTQNTNQQFPTGQNQLSYSNNGKPLFRNPALEEQERKIAEEKARKEAMQQQPMQQTTMQQPVQQAQVQPQPMQQAPMGPPPIINGQPVATNQPQQPQNPNGINQQQGL